MDSHADQMMAAAAELRQQLAAARLADDDYEEIVFWMLDLVLQRRAVLPSRNSHKSKRDVEHSLVTPLPPPGRLLVELRR